MERYRATQIGWFMAAVFILMLVVDVILFAVLLAMGVEFFSLWAPMLTCLGVALIIGVFSSLTVVIRNDVIRIHFGPGLIWKTFRLKDIESCAVVRNKWWWGWGIRKIPRGWLYNVAGLDAVELTMRTGRVYRIGTDLPHELHRAITQALECVPK